MRRWVLAVLVFLAAFVLPGGQPGQQALAGGQPGASPQVAPFECPFPIRAGDRIECFLVSVPQDHDQPAGPTLQLAVALVHSVASQPVSDPVIYVDGGPGNKTLERVSGILPWVRPILAERDIVFFDQRGAGFSQPALDCPEWTGQLLDNLLQRRAPGEGADRLVAAATACRDRLAAAGVDRAVYTSAQFAADVEAIGLALGYERWNLYGVGYGTRVALEALRGSPARVRSIVLDSVVPPAADLLGDAPANAAAALHALFARCQADLLCRVAYPDAESAYQERVDDLDRNPHTLTTTNPLTEEPVRIVLDGHRLAGLALALVQNPLAAPSLPALVDELRAGHDDRVGDLVWIQMSGAQGLSWGAFFATRCGADAALDNAASLEALRAAPVSAGDEGASMQTLYQVCQAWGEGRPAARTDPPGASDVPTLILAGEYDAQTSPAYRQTAEAMLTHSTFYEFPGLGHGVLTGGECPLAVVRSFLDRPDAVPEAGCIDKITIPPFVVTVTPTQPYGRALAAVAGLVALAAVAFLLFQGIARRGYRRSAWRGSWRRAGWWPLAANAAALAGLLAYLSVTGQKEQIPLVIEGTVALAAAVHAALLLTLNDEPALEVLLACPRPAGWLLLERLLLVLAAHGAVGLVGTAAGIALGGETDVLLALVRWLAPTVLLSGVALFFTVRSREPALGLGVVVLAWFGTLFARGMLLPAQLLGLPFPRPLYLMQPLLWPLHPYLQPNSLPLADYILNRVVLIGLGCLLIALAVRRLHDTEWALLGRRTARKLRAGRESTESDD